MDAVLIANWNSRVKPEDTIFFLGDFAFRNSPGGKLGEGVPVKEDYYKKKLNGNIVSLAGNHDHRGNVKCIISSINIMFGGRDIHLIHNPQTFEVGKLNLCGHVHNLWLIRWFNSETPIVNCGVDVHHFMTVSINEILSIVAKNPYRNGI